MTSTRITPKAFAKAKSAGVEALAFSCRLSPEEISLVKAIALEI